MAISQRSMTAPLRPAAEATRIIAPDARRRLLHLVGLFRLVAGLALLAVSLAGHEMPLLNERMPLEFRMVAILYMAAAGLILVYQRHYPIPGPWQVPLLLCLDIGVILLLVYTGGGTRSGLGGLLVVFVGAAALSLSGRLAFLGAAVATIGMLLEQALAFSQGLAPADDFIATGTLGAVMFAIVAAAIPLARRLEESEALAHQRGIDLANLAQLNEYIIANLRESILVVDASDHIRLMNQPAAEQLGAGPLATGQPLQRVAPGLARLLEAWRLGAAPGRQMPTFLSADGSTRLNSHVAPIEGHDDGPVLIFLEDAGVLAQKVQQSKLAALGRLTASIAHEVRNPVGAMSHAGQLLEESPAIGPGEQRLLEIIRTNSQRVSNIVESILQLSRREAGKPRLLSLAEWTQGFITEFSSTLELFEGQISASGEGDVQVRMDPGHLHQVVWNLCENAVKYASEAAGGISVELSWRRLPGSRRPCLEIADRGPGIDPALIERVFEPFATGRSGGTGLGLFISRELCEYNRATLTCEPRSGGGSCFRIVFADPERWGGTH